MRSCGDTQADKSVKKCQQGHSCKLDKIQDGAMCVGIIYYAVVVQDGTLVFQIRSSVQSRLPALKHAV